MKTQSKAPALEKGLQILEHLAQASEFLTLTQIAHGTNYKISQIQRMVDQLLVSGFLIRNQAGAYYLSNKLFILANKNPPQQARCVRYAIRPVRCQRCNCVNVTDYRRLPFLLF